MLIKNAKLVTEKNDYVIRDVLVEDGKISKISEKLEVTDREVLDLNGEKFLIPGIIDAHTHMRDPGLTHKEDLSTGSLACARGGITTFFDMPNTVPATITEKALEEKREIARNSSHVNFGFHFGGSLNDNSGEIKKINGVGSTKVFLNVSTGKMLIEDDSTLENIFKESNMISCHAEGEMVAKAINFNEKYGKGVYLAHMSSGEEVGIAIEARKTAKKPIYVEVTPHHLYLSTDDVVQTEETKMLLRMKPELKEKSDIEALWKAIEEGHVDTIGTDHAPHKLDEKLAKVTFGVPGVETSLSLMLTAVNEGKITLEKLQELMSKNPAKIFKIANKGEIKEGFDADLVVIDLEKEYEIKNEDMISKCGWTPFNGKKVKGAVEATIVNGNIIYNENKFNKEIKGREVKIND